MSDSIVKTLAYFDIFNTPLTREEIYHWLWHGEAKWLELTDELNKLKANKIIEYKHGYYFLPGRMEIASARQRSVPMVEKKMAIARRAGKKLRWLPFVEAMFVCNTVALGGVKPASDIDVFIIIKPGRLWLARFLITLVLGIFGLRRNKKNITDKVCLSFYAADDALDLSAVKISDPDIYLIYWLDNLIPVYDPKNIHKEILKQNQWAKKYLPNGLLSQKTLPRWRADDSKLSAGFRYFFERAWQGGYGNLMERQAKEIQKTKMKLNFASAQNQGGLGVVINDSMLKFHENDRREEYRDLWLKKINSLFSPPGRWRGKMYE